MAPVRREPSQWPILFDLAIDIIDQASKVSGASPEWTFGGGTALMLQIDHRESFDIDLFLDDPQFLPFLNPETQGHSLSRMPDGYQTDGFGSLKLAYEGVGEIDFICCGVITECPVKQEWIRGNEVRLETPAEIIAKKICYRGSLLQPRDMFDLAATAEKLGDEYARAALAQCGTEACQKALSVSERMDPKLASSVIAQLMYREHNEHLVTTAQQRTIDLLRKAAS